MKLVGQIAVGVFVGNLILSLLAWLTFTIVIDYQVRKATRQAAQDSLTSEIEQQSAIRRAAEAKGQAPRSKAP
jgi:hypothetical protein